MMKQVIPISSILLEIAYFRSHKMVLMKTIRVFFMILRYRYIRLFEELDEIIDVHLLVTADYVLKMICCLKKFITEWVDQALSKMEYRNQID